MTTEDVNGSDRFGDPILSQRLVDRTHFINPIIGYNIFVNFPSSRQWIMMAV